MQLYKRIQQKLMSEEIISIHSISRLHEILGFERPQHPLITIIDVTEFHIPAEMLGLKVSTAFYYIGLKTSNCGMQYGRNHYDFEEGVLVFTGPNQVISVTEEMRDEVEEGWMLFFHPDLIRPFPLGSYIEDYTFFSYETHEALHLSDHEKQVMLENVERIREEYTQRIDNHSQRVIVSSLELMLNYCARFYERQFNTRKAQNKDVVTELEKILKEYFNSGALSEKGPPSVQYCAEQVHLSPNYLSDLLRKETGRSAKDHINGFLVEKAKNMLLGSNNTISEIAYALGFNYPHYFSRLFKGKTGMTPQQYREMN